MLCQHWLPEASPLPLLHGSAKKLGKTLAHGSKLSVLKKEKARKERYGESSLDTIIEEGHPHQLNQLILREVFVILYDSEL